MAGCNTLTTGIPDVCLVLLLIYIALPWRTTLCLSSQRLCDALLLEAHSVRICTTMYTDVSVVHLCTML